MKTTMTMKSGTRAGLVVALLGTFALGGCATMNDTRRGGLIGAAAGAAVGAAIGNNNGGTARGAIIGAALGGAAGAFIGRRMDQKAEELEERLPEADVERVGEGILVTFDSGILFDFDSAELRPEAIRNLSQLAASLEDLEDDAILMIVGHTDSTGADDYNLRLSRRRAEAAEAFLLGGGLSSNRTRTVGLGETEPVATNETEAGRAENRRVEIAIYASESYQQEILSRGGS